MNLHPYRLLLDPQGGDGNGSSGDPPVVVETTNEPTPETGIETKETPEQMRAAMERMQTALAKANKEAESRRLKLNAYEKAEQEKKDAELSEAERLKKESHEKDTRLQSAETALKAERIGRKVERAATAMAFHDPEDAMVPAVLDALEFDEDGHPSEKSIKAALKALVEKKPYLTTATDGSKRPATINGTPPRRSTPPQPTVKPEPLAKRRLTL